MLKKINHITFLKTTAHLGMALLLFLTWSCANIVAPTGGPKDITPPKLVKSEPVNYSINFDEKQIRLYFDEFVQVKDANKYMLISPPVEVQPELKIKGKSVILNFEEKFLPNTTYSIYFGQSIVDLTEGNPTNNLRFVFSTGNHIDSLQYRGTAMNALSLQPVKEATVMLYDKDEDSVVFKQKPLYITRSDEYGQFQFYNLADKYYKIFGLLEKNGNYLYDQNTEEIAFNDTLVHPVRPQLPDTGKVDSVKVRTEIKSLPKLLFFLEKDTIQRVAKKFMAKPRQLILIFRQPVQKLEFNPVNHHYAELIPFLKTEFNNTRDTINVWITKREPMDSLSIAIKADGKSYDTLNLDIKKFEKAFRAKRSTEKADKISYSTNSSAGFDLNHEFRVNFAYPILKWDSSNILFVEDKDTMKIKARFIDPIQRNLSISKPWKENTTYQILFPKDIFEDINGNKNDSLIITFKTKSLRDYGNLKLSIKGANNEHYLIQLLDAGDRVTREETILGLGVCNFAYLNPGKYKVRAVVDRNKNGRWDTGRYIKKTQPEKVLYFPKELEVRSNWDLEEDWVF